MELFFIFQILVLLMSVVIHEVSHGYAAEQLGDPTARLAGRLTLNPLKHLDMFGSVILPILLLISHSPIVLGWAKPVPYNPYRLVKDLKYGPLKVALAGPLSNIIVAVVFGVLLRFIHPFIPAELTLLLGVIVFINFLLAVFNLIPIPPLDGSKILTVLLPAKYSLMLQRIGLIGLFLVVFFLIYFGGVIFLFAATLFQWVAGSAAFQIFMSSLGGAL